MISRRTLLTAFFGLVAVFFYLISTTQLSAGAGHLMISEVYPRPPLSGSPSEHEWVELHNPTGTAIDVSGWRLLDDSQEDVLPSFSIPPGGHLVVASSMTAFIADHPGFAGSIISLEQAIGGGLGDGGDRLRLLSRTGVENDAMSFGRDDAVLSPPCPAPLTGQSLARFPPEQDSDSAADWLVATTPSPGEAARGLEPTPTPAVSPTLSPTVTLTATPVATVTPATLSWPSYPGDVVINEVMIRPAAVPAPYGQWFELHNTTSHTIDLSRWSIADDGSDAHRIAESGSLWLPAGGYLVLGSSADPGRNGRVVVDYVYDGFTLLSGADQIVLLDATGQVVDYVAYDAAWPYFPAPGASMALLDPNLDNAAGVNWRPSFRAWPSGAGDFGSPGAANPIPPIGQIEGFVYEDLNGNRHREPDEPGLTGVLITLSDGQYLRTFPGGWYGFYGLAAGTYTMVESQPAGYESTTPDRLTVTIGQTEVLWGNDFGERLLPTATPSPSSTPTAVYAASVTPSITPSAAPSATPTHTAIAPSPTVTCTAGPLPEVRINEFLARPAELDWDDNGTPDADDEWIELFGLAGGPVDLGGWMLDDRADGGTSPFVIPVGYSLDEQGFLLLFRSTTGVALNDDGDTVRLLSPDGAEIDSFVFTHPSRDGSFSRAVDGYGEWTAGYPASPGGPNRPPAPTATPTASMTATPTPTASVTPTCTPTPTATYWPPNPGELRLNEFLPYPSGVDWDGDGQAKADDEWIELINLAGHPIDLTGWQLDDATGGSAPYRFPLGSTLPARGFGLFFRALTGVALNNDADTVRLLDPGGTLVDGWSYVDAHPNFSHSRTIDGGGTWTEAFPPSPGDPNLAATPTPTPTSYPDGMALNEVLPAPKKIDWDGSGTVDLRDEWIEVFNGSGSLVELGGWSLADNSRAFLLPEDTAIGSGGFLLFFRSQTGLALDNNSDRVALLRPDGVLVDEFSYPRGPGSDRSFCRTADGIGPWTTGCYVTPGQANRMLPTPIPGSGGSSPSAGGARSGSAVPVRLTVAEARSAELGTRAIISGVVTYPSGLYVRNIYLQDATGGLRVYLAKGEFPPLPLGERVEATGRLRDYHGELELYLSKPEDAVDLGAGPSLIPVWATTGSVDEAIEGLLVRVGGRVVDYGSAEIVLDDGSGPVRVFFPEGSPFRRPVVQRDEFWSTAGVIGQYVRARPYEGGYRLLPRMEADVSLPPAFLPVTGGAVSSATAISGRP